MKELNPSYCAQGEEFDRVQSRDCESALIHKGDSVSNKLFCPFLSTTLFLFQPYAFRLYLGSLRSVFHDKSKYDETLQ